MTKALLASSVLTVRHLNCWRAALLLLLDYVSRYVSAFADVLRAELTFGTFWTAFFGESFRTDTSLYFIQIHESCRRCLKVVAGEIFLSSTGRGKCLSLRD